MIKYILSAMSIFIFFIGNCNYASGKEKTVPLAEILPQKTSLYIKLPGISNLSKQLAETNLSTIFNNKEIQSYTSKAWQDKPFVFAELLTMLKFEEADEINILKNDNLKYFEALDPLFDFLLSDITLAVFNAADKEITCCMINTETNIDINKIFEILKKAFPKAAAMAENNSVIVLADKLYIKQFNSSIIIANDAPIISKFIIPGLKNRGLQGSLASNAHFSDMRKKVSDSSDGFFIYATSSIIKSSFIKFLQVAVPATRNLFADLTESFPADKNFLSLAAGGTVTPERQIKHTIIIKTAQPQDNFQPAAEGLVYNLLQPALTVGENTEYFLSMRLPAEYIYKYINRNLTAALGKNFSAKFTEAVKKIEKRTDFSFSAELKKVLGTTCSIIPAPGSSKPNAFPPNLILRFDILDKGRLEKIMGAIRIISSPLGWRKVVEGDITIYYLNRFGIPLPLSPAYMIKDMNFYAAAYPQQLRALLKMEQKKTPKLVVNPLFKNVSKQVNSQANTAFAFFNTKEETATLYEEIICLLFSLTAVDGFTADPAILPPAENLSAEWAASALSCNIENNNLTIEACGPAGLLSPLLWYAGQTAREMRGRKGIMNNAMLIGATIPLVFRKHQLQIRSLSYKRLQHIGKAYIAFLNKHGRPPANFNDLIENNLLLKKFSFFPTENEKYKYAFLKPRQRFKATAPVVHEPILKDTKGVYVLFADGHIEWINRRRLENILGIRPLPADGSAPDKNIEVF